MKQRKLSYRFHDPNPAAVTADYILKIFIEANTGKVEAAQPMRNRAAARDTPHDAGCPSFLSAFHSLQHIIIADQRHIAQLTCFLHAALGKAGLGKQKIVYLAVWEQPAAVEQRL